MSLNQAHEVGCGPALLYSLYDAVEIMLWLVVVNRSGYEACECDTKVLEIYFNQCNAKKYLYRHDQRTSSRSFASMERYSLRNCALCPTFADILPSVEQ